VPACQRAAEGQTGDLRRRALADVAKKGAGGSVNDLTAWRAALVRRCERDGEVQRGEPEEHARNR